jgi:hypothetical protein
MAVLAALLVLLTVNLIWSAPNATRAKQTQSQTRNAPTPAPTVDAAAAAKKAEEFRDKNRQLALLDEARRFTAAGDYAKANETIISVLKATNDPDVVKEAQTLSHDNQPTLLAKLGLAPATLFKTASWWIDILLGILILLALYAILRLARFLRSETRGREWRLERIADDTNLGVADLMIESFGRWGSETPALASGLITLERLQLPSIDWLKPAAASLDLSEALKDLSVRVGGNLVTLSGIASAGKGIRDWLNATCPSIQGKAIWKGANLMVTVTARARKKTWTVTESRQARTDSGAVAPPANPSIPSFSGMPATVPFTPDEIQNATYAATYKIFYLISRPGSTLSQAEAANSLREGLNQLWKHVATENPDKLEHAYEAFREARTREDNFYQAYLYEGIALDLLSQHDEAIKRFEYLENENRMKDPPLREKATYNRAISLFRKYQLPATRQAEKVLNTLIAGIADKPENSQIKSMALAAKASVIAQYPMYWSVLRSASEEASIAATENRNEREDAVIYWKGKVALLNERLDAILKTVKAGGKWSRDAERQLEWAINNAWGSIHLNLATYVCASADSEPDRAEGQKTRREYLNLAYDAFQNCAMLLSPGVENLTNLAKVTLELGRFAQGRAYLEQVIKMNPAYEYAYYRLAKEWERQHDPAKVVEILKAFKGTPVIPSFIKLFERYKVAT